MYVLPKKHTGNFIYQAKEGYFLTLSRTPDVHVDPVGFFGENHGQTSPS